jgi:hypothetical protein
MPTNTSITSAIKANTVPPDRNCPRDGQAMVDLVQDFCTIQSTTTQSGGGTTDSVAQQALQQSAIALATAQQALAAAPNVRSGGPIAIPVGDSQITITWSPAMPDTNYAVLGTYYGPGTHPAAFYCFQVVDGSRTVDNCKVSFENTPANFKWAFVVMELP